ncbi:hypothetical protein [Pseudoprevotella muciniphila]|uniref:hypothetical protein n=1 Tax=Pseudoprevotella muciniphila TaxID=2133944 RepID=UPI001D02ECC2|nr:hypothetical protein [Pseudoprevotella muciniphila]
MSVKSYHRFYALFNRLSGVDREDMKETLVSSFTDGRTTSLREMTQKEYNAMCASLEERTGWKAQLKKKRSLCLKLMQKAGVDTTDWQRINDFCSNPKIAGRVFAQLGVKDLDALQVKLRAIMSKGGLKGTKTREAAPQSQHTEPEPCLKAIPLTVMGEA